jgi:hypothetical protein
MQAYKAKILTCVLYRCATYFITNFTSFISVHIINIAKQSQLMHNIIGYLFIFFVHLLSDMFRQGGYIKYYTVTFMHILCNFWYSPLDNGIVTCRNMSGRRCTKNINKWTIILRISWICFAVFYYIEGTTLIEGVCRLARKIFRYAMEEESGKLHSW